MTQHHTASATADKQMMDSGSHTEIEKTAGSIATGGFVRDEAMEKRVRRKADCVILPITTFIFLINYIDRSAVGNAYVAGLGTDLQLSIPKYEYNIGLMVFYILYMFIELPVSLIIIRYGAKVLCVLMLFFGATTIGSAWMQNYGDFLAIRALLGAFEGGVGPGSALIMAMYYRRRELAFRTGIFYAVAPSIAGAFGGLLSAALLNIKSIGTVTGWRVIFLVYGIITCGLSVVCFLLLPASPETAWFLNEEERKYALARIQSEQLVLRRPKITMAAIRHGFTNINTWLICIMWIFVSIPVIGTGIFLPSVVQGLGYKTAISANLHTVPQYVFAIFTGIAIPYLAMRTRRHGLVLVASMLVATIGYVIYIATQDFTARYVSTFFTYPFASPCPGIILGWAVANSAPETGRAVTTGILGTIVPLGGIASTWTFLPKYSPRNLPGSILNLVACAMGLLLLAVVLTYIKWENKQRDMGRRDWRLVDAEQKGIRSEDLGHQSPDFRYIE